MSALRRLTIAAACCAGSFLAPANAYERATHEDLTGAAVDRSILATGAVLSDLGLKGARDGTQEFPNTSGAKRTILNLFRDGARFEDNVFPTIRPLRHFYNPINGEGLNVPVLPTQMSSPDWALARPGTVSAQERSYWNARQSLFAALTKPLQAERQAAFGETFQFLGQVLHHLQDMAQPQHVRNDAHCDWFPCSLVGSGRSRYESWTNDVRGNLPTDPPSGYNITSPTFTSVFNSPRRFWHTETGQNSLDTGKGIAEFTNRNFVSYGTNFDRPNLFPSPVPDRLDPDVDIQALCQNAMPACPPGLHGRMTFYGNTVKDKFLGSSADTANPRASTFSTFDQDLISRGAPPRFSLNRFNFQAAHNFLIPRAVAYSAGMINYFFRGKIDLVPDDTNPGTFLIKNLGNEPMTGDFRLYYDNDAGTVNNRTLHIEWLNRSIPANDQRNIGTISDPTNPAPKIPGEYMLVFEGTMGEGPTAEVGAVVGKAVNLNPFLIFAVDRIDFVGESEITFSMFLPEGYAQRFMLNPSGVTVQMADWIFPPTSSEGGSCSNFGVSCEILRSDIPGIDVGGGRLYTQLGLTQNNAFVVRAQVGPVFFGNTPEDLSLISPSTLCADSTSIYSTFLFVGGYALGSYVQVRLSFEGKVLFEFVVSPPPFDSGPVVLTNAKGVRLTDVNCRVSIQ